MSDHLTVGELKEVLNRHPDDLLIVGTVWNDLMQTHFLLEARKINTIQAGPEIHLQIDFEPVGTIDIKDETHLNN